MKKKLKLDSASEFPKNFIGIASQFKDIQIVWSLNNLINFNFVKTEDFKKEVKNSNTVFYFSMFQYFDEQNFKHYLIANKNKNSILFPKYKTIDFIYISNVSDEQFKKNNTRISESEMIIGNFILPFDNLISKAFKCLFEE